MIGGFVAIVGGILLCTAVIIVVIILVSRPVGRGTCERWGNETGYRTKFVILNFVDTGTCLAQTKDGRWVKNTQVRDIAGLD